MRSAILNFVYAITFTSIAWKATASSPLGSPCATFNDCDGDLICTGGLCSELPTTETCSWAGHGIGSTCSTFNDCSDALVCNANSVCVDPNANNQQPFIVYFDCWNDTFAAPILGCEGHVRCPPSGGSETEFMLEVKGQHFNTGNVELQVLSGASVIYSTTVAAAAGNSGELAGSFDIKTTALCPGRHQAVGVKLTDSCTGRVVQLSFPAE